MSARRPHPSWRSDGKFRLKHSRPSYITSQWRNHSLMNSLDWTTFCADINLQRTMPSDRFFRYLVHKAGWWMKQPGLPARLPKVRSYARAGWAGEERRLDRAWGPILGSLQRFYGWAPEELRNCTPDRTCRTPETKLRAMNFTLTGSCSYPRTTWGGCLITESSWSWGACIP